MIFKLVRNIVIILILLFIALYISDREFALSLLKGMKEFCVNMSGGFKYLL